MAFISCIHTMPRLVYLHPSSTRMIGQQHWQSKTNSHLITSWWWNPIGDLSALLAFWEEIPLTNGQQCYGFVFVLLCTYTLSWPQKTGGHFNVKKPTYLYSRTSISDGNFPKNIHKRHPIAYPWGWTMGCPLWVHSPKWILNLSLS